MHHPENPLKKTNLSLCMIVKYERQNLPRCLASVQPYVNEIVVVDTGSEDETPEIAKQFGARLEYFKWCNDFAAARNYALSKVTGDWILVLDADEELIVTSEDFFTQLTSSPEIIAYSLSLTDVDSPQGMTPLQTPRLFRNREEFRYVSGYHEQLTYQGRAISHNLIGQLDGLKILHYGYGVNQIYQKNINRNIPILESIRQQERLSIMLLYCLAGMYSDTQQIEKAQECYSEAFDKLLPDLMDGTVPEQSGFVPSLMFVLGTQFLQEEDYETVRLICQRGLEWFPNHPPLNYLTGSVLKILGFPLGATVYFKTCLELNRNNNYYKEEPFEQRYMTTYPAYELGRLYIELEKPQEALAAFELVLSFDVNFMDAQQKVDMIKQYLATQA
jgi:glycosyltransferase involved in cell wall biosynthesis